MPAFVGNVRIYGDSLITDAKIRDVNICDSDISGSTMHDSKLTNVNICDSDVSGSTMHDSSIITTTIGHQSDANKCKEIASDVFKAHGKATLEDGLDVTGDAKFFDNIIINDDALQFSDDKHTISLDAGHLTIKEQLGDIVLHAEHADKQIKLESSSVKVTGNLNVNGNLRVDGTITTINSTDVKIKDTTTIQAIDNDGMADPAWLAQCVGGTDDSLKRFGGLVMNATDSNHCGEMFFMNNLETTDVENNNDIYNDKLASTYGAATKTAVDDSKEVLASSHSQNTNSYGIVMKPLEIRYTKASKPLESRFIENNQNLFLLYNEDSGLDEHAEYSMKPGINNGETKTLIFAGDNGHGNHFIIKFTNDSSRKISPGTCESELQSIDYPYNTAKELYVKLSYVGQSLNLVWVRDDATDNGEGKGKWYLHGSCNCEITDTL